MLTWQLGIRLQNICKKQKNKQRNNNKHNTGWNAILPAIRCGVTETQNNCRASQPGVQPRTFWFRSQMPYPMRQGRCAISCGKVARRGTVTRVWAPLWPVMEFGKYVCLTLLGHACVIIIVPLTLIQKKKNHFFLSFQVAVRNKATKHL